MVEITKTFPGVVANDTVNFDLRPGEVHTLLGENGAGKTTLMNVLSGLYQPDSGSIEVKGETVKIGSPFDSLKLGIGMVHQHFALVPTLTVLENIILGFEGGVILDWDKEEKKLKQISEEFGLPVDVGEKVRDLGVGEQQRVEIVKALFRGSEVLILDEPTSVLTPMEIDGLFQTISSLTGRGKAVVFITHKLNEALRISDRISVLKLGKKVAEMSGPELREMGEGAAARRILDVMFGGVPLPESGPVDKHLQGSSLLELNDVVCLSNRGVEALKRVSLEVREGEIFGIAGVDGNGQKELAEVVAGQRRAVSGRVVVGGVDVTQLGTSARSALGVSYVTDERMEEGCILSMNVAENCILRQFREKEFSHWALIDNSAVNRHTVKLIEEFNIKTAGPGARVRTMSGGNIQKLLLARELSTKPRVIVCNKPTHGLDARTTRYIQERLQEESRRGAAVLLISSDLDELLSYSDRMGVLYNGEILGVVGRAEATAERIGKLMLGMRS